MTKLVHFIHGLNTGGAETLVKDYALNFDRKKFDVTVLCISHEKESPYEKILMDNGVRVIFVEDYLWCKNRTGMVAKFMNHFQRYFVARKLLRKESPDVLHTHLHLNKYVEFAKPSKKTVVFHTVHSEPKVFWSNDEKKCRKDLASAKWLVKNYGMRFIVLHEKMRKEVNEMFGVGNSVVLNNGIDVNRFRMAKNGDVVRKKLKILKDALVVGHVGRFAEVKNHSFLVDVFAQIKKQNKFLLMVGDGENKKNIIKKLEDAGLEGKYLILSNCDDIPDLLNAMDVFVFPSKYEGLGMALVEAQEVGLPCFVSDKVPKHATISNLVKRLSLDDGPEKWAEEILSYKKPKKIVVNDEDWNIKKITKQLEQLYLDALVEKKNGEK